MTEDINTLITWIRVCLVVAAISTTAFPVLYAFFPWRSTRLGQLLMLQAVAFAIAIDLTLLFQFWAPSNMLVLFWVNALVFNLIAVSTAALTVLLWRANHQPHEQRELKRRKTDV